MVDQTIVRAGGQSRSQRRIAPPLLAASERPVVRRWGLGFVAKHVRRGTCGRALRRQSDGGQRTVSLSDLSNRPPN
jgi:hypothetical protein